MRVAGVQHDIVFEDALATLQRLEPLVAEAAADADLVVLAEMFSTGFTMRPAQVAESIDGPSVSFLLAQAERHGVWLAGSVPTNPGDGGLAVNRLHVVGPAGEQHHYDKLHPFSYGGEHEHYRAGNRTLTVEICGVRCSWFVCYDLRFAPPFWDLAPATDAYVVVANWPSRRRAHWDRLLEARGIENQAYVVAVNRVGNAGRLGHDGGTAILDPLGVKLADVADGIEGVAFADITAEKVAEVRAKFPFLADRRS